MMEKNNCVSFSINDSSDMMIVIENCVIVYMNIVSVDIVVYVGDDVELTDYHRSRFDSIGVNIIHSDNTTLDQATIMNGCGYRERYIIHETATPIDMFSIKQWMMSDSEYLVLTTNNSFVFCGYCGDSEEFCNWLDRFNGEDFRGFYSNHIEHHIPNATHINTQHNTVAYSLWGTDLLYLNGAKHNANQVKKFYPDWECRIYVDESISYELVDELSSLGVIIYFRNASDGSSGMLWRFEVMFDMCVDYFCIRDADSRITYREKLAVDEWVASGKGFHVMRDHPGHGTPILGGMWGGRASKCAKYRDVFYRDVFGDHKGYDQEFLTRYLWRDVRIDMVCHRSHIFPAYTTASDRHFPITLEHDYHVGAIVPQEETGDDWYSDSRKGTVYEN